MLFICVFQVTYLLEGSIAHEDFCGHSGRLKSGDLQVWLSTRGPLMIFPMYTVYC